MASVSSELLFGRWQIKHFLLSSLARTLEAFPTMVMIFADYEPHWHCNGGKTPEDFLSVKPRFESCSPTGSICSMDRASWDWDGGPGVSTVCGWDLVCGQKYKVGFLQSAFFVGCLLGNWYFQPLCAFISDGWSPLRFSFSFWFIFWYRCRDIWASIGFFAGAWGCPEVGLHLQCHFLVSWRQCRRISGFI